MSGIPALENSQVISCSCILKSSHSLHVGLSALQLLFCLQEEKSCTIQQFVCHQKRSLLCTIKLLLRNLAILNSADIPIPMMETLKQSVSARSI